MADFANLLQNLESSHRDNNDDLDSDELNYFAGNDQEEAPEDAEFEQLKRWWTQELASPGDLMPYDSDIIDMHLELLQGQEDIIDRLLENSNVDEAGSANVALEVSLYRMEIDRLRYILADLTRTRIAKIERYALHMRTTPEEMNRASEGERQYLQIYGKLMERHLHRTVLQHLPRSFRGIDKEEMIDRPNLDEFVFCHVLEMVTIETGDDEDVMGDSYDGDEENLHEHAAGTSLIVRYRTIKDLVDEGKVVLLY